MKNASRYFNEKPQTRLGWWAVWLGLAFVAMFLINTFVFMPTSSDAPWRHVILPFYGILMLLCGLCSGIAGFIAVFGQHERAWPVLLTLVPAAWVIFMLVGEFLFTH
jgi:hypothetical protein